jgi:hypothetical protein
VHHKISSVFTVLISFPIIYSNCSSPLHQGLCAFPCLEWLLAPLYAHTFRWIFAIIERFQSMGRRTRTAMSASEVDHLDVVLLELARRNCGVMLAGYDNLRSRTSRLPIVVALMIHEPPHNCGAVASRMQCFHRLGKLM